MIEKLKPLNVMNSSPSISNYENLGLYINRSYSSSSASERNGRAVRRVFRKPKPVVEAWNVEECNIQLRSENGSVREVSGYQVSRGEVVKRFVNIESVQRFISQN
jgi:hypothetical protein